MYTNLREQNFESALKGKRRIQSKNYTNNPPPTCVDYTVYSKALSDKIE